MNGEQRRQEIITLLKRSAEPVSGAELARLLHVSRQIIVQDIALLKAADHQIFSTYKGYLLHTDSSKRRIITVRHRRDQIADELYTIVDFGGRILDVFVNHDVYGELKVAILLASRSDVDEFIKQLDIGKVSPLMQLTDDLHHHTIEADAEETLNRISEELKQKGYLTQAH